MKSPQFSISTLDGDRLSASSASHFTTEERDPGIPWIGERVCCRAGVDANELQYGFEFQHNFNPKTKPKYLT
jgi:hypothetical protein